MKRKIIKEKIDEYFDLKAEHDYLLNKESTTYVVTDVNLPPELKTIKQTPTYVISFLNKDINRVGPSLNIASKEAIEKLHPDKIDINYFWEYLTQKFPCYPISGHPECRTPEDVNKANLFAHKKMDTIAKLDELFAENSESSIFEIGPGYGNILHYLQENYNDENYYAIDVNPLFEHDRVFKCDGRNIPEDVGSSFDIVYSVNVFQHLSKKQRSSYYEQIYNILKPGGAFTFSMFVFHPQNKDNLALWGLRGEDGRPYCHMLSQITEVDTFEEIDTELKGLGFSYDFKLMQNLGVFFCKKD